MVELRHRTAKERGQKDRFVSIYVEKNELRFSKKSLVSHADMTFKNRLFFRQIEIGEKSVFEPGARFTKARSAYTTADKSCFT